MTLADLFAAEVNRYGLTWCTGECDSRASHKRGFATKGVVHLDRRIGTRSSLLTGLHEIAHVVLWDEQRKQRRYQREAGAEAWARKRMRELGVPVPRKDVQQGDAYVRRMKRWGDRSIEGRKAAAAPKVQTKGRMQIRPEESEALSHIASRWWGGPDEGAEVVVTLRFRKPTTRTDQAVVDLFAEFLGHLNGGYRSTVSMPRSS